MRPLHTVVSGLNRTGGCCVLAASCVTAGVLLADTGLIDSLLSRAIKGLIGEKMGPIEMERRGEIETEISISS